MNIKYAISMRKKVTVPCDVWFIVALDMNIYQQILIKIGKNKIV